MHVWACAKSIQMNYSEEDTTMSYRSMNKTMQANIHDMLLIINRLELIMRDHKLLDFH